MTRIVSYQLLGCHGCGQKHILPNYGSINLTFGLPPIQAKSDDLMVCQRCSEQKPLNQFLTLETLSIPKQDQTPVWLKKICKVLDVGYKESELHPVRLYPYLSTVPFDPETYYDGIVKKYMDQENSYPTWFRELAQIK